MAKVDAKWLQFNTNSIEIDPNNSKKFRVKLKDGGGLLHGVDGLSVDPAFVGSGGASAASLMRFASEGEPVPADVQKDFYIELPEPL